MPSATAVRFGRAFVELVADLNPLNRGLQAAEATLLQSTRRMGAVIAGSGAVTLFGLLPAVNAASKRAETLNAFTQTFQGANREAEALASTLANQIGRSTSSIREIATPIGAMAKGLGLSSEEAAKFAVNAAAAAQDISSFYNQGVEETAVRVRAALSGSSEAVDQFGINLRASALSAKLAELGYDSNLQSASELEKTLARLALIQESLARQNALGDAARTADQFANSSRSLSDALGELIANVGQAVLPAFELITNQLARLVTVMADFVGRHPLLVQAFVAMQLAVTAFGAALVGLSAIGGTILLISKLTFMVTLARLALTAMTSAIVRTQVAMVTAASSTRALTAAIQGLTLATSRVGMSIGTFLAKLPLFRIIVPVLKGIAAAFTVLASGVGLVVAAVLSLTGVATGIAYLNGKFAAGSKVANAWSGMLVTAFQGVRQAFARLWSLVGTAGRSLGQVFSDLLGTAKPVLSWIADFVEARLVGAIELAAGALQTLTAGMNALYDLAAGLGLVVSREELERGERLQKAIDARKAKQQEGNGGAAGNAAPGAEVADEGLQQFAERVREDLETPLEKHDKYMQQLQAAFDAGLLTAEQFRRGQQQAAEDLKQQLEGGFDPVKQFAEQMAESVRTPEEVFNEQMSKLTEAAMLGEVTAETLRRGQIKLREELEQAQADQRQALEDAAKQQKQAIAEELNRRFAEPLKLAQIGGDFDRQIAIRKQKADLLAGQDPEAAREDRLGILEDLVNRARDFTARAADSQSRATLSTSSRLEAVAGLGTETVDEKLLAEAEKQSQAEEEMMLRLGLTVEEIQRLQRVIRGEE